MNTSIFSQIVHWQKLSGRHHLPWQKTLDPYHIWLSEIMLQQTQVKTVIAYYERFLDKFPNIHMLAAADIDEVLALWAGLGYYARARNLHQCAKQVVEQYDGKFPQDVSLLQQLPGIGKTTAAAISAFAFGGKHSIMDANVQRILRRYFAIDLDNQLSKSQIDKKLWQRAAAQIPENATHEEMIAYTQGLMDLGSIVCPASFARCLCLLCPLQLGCEFKKNPVETVQRKTTQKKIHKKHFFLVFYEDKVLLEKRQPKGIWGGLSSFPECEYSEKSNFLHAFQAESLLSEPLSIIEHSFTHFDLVAYVWPVTLNIDLVPQNWYLEKVGALESIALPAPIKRYTSTETFHLSSKKYTTLQIDSK